VEKNSGGSGEEKTNLQHRKNVPIKRGPHDTWLEKGENQGFTRKQRKEGAGRRQVSDVAAWKGVDLEDRRGVED